jgi:hypothetical protein
MGLPATLNPTGVIMAWFLGLEFAPKEDRFLVPSVMRHEEHQLSASRLYRSTMAEQNRGKRWPIGWVVAAISVTAVVAAIGLAVMLFSRYVQDEDADAPAAARAFQRARAQFTGQAPLLELRGAQPPLFHRRPSAAAARPIVAVRGIIYDASDESLRRFAIPIGVVRLLTIGGRSQLMDFGTLGNEAGLTLADLERHGPGLVVDVGGASIVPLAVSDALMGTMTKDSQVLIWTE